MQSSSLLVLLFFVLLVCVCVCVSGQKIEPGALYTLDKGATIKQFQLILLFILRQCLTKLLLLALNLFCNRGRHKLPILLPQPLKWQACTTRPGWFSLLSEIATSLWQKQTQTAIRFLTLTAVDCDMTFSGGPCTPAPGSWGHIDSNPSLHPLESSLPSGDHFRAHTASLWWSVPTWCWATRTSWWWTRPNLDPLN